VRGLNPGWRRDFLHPSRTVLRPNQPPRCTGSFPGKKWPGHGLNHPIPSSAKVKERVEIYPYSPSVPS